METIYAKWQEIKSLREKQNFISQPFKLNIRQYMSVYNSAEIEFQLNPMAPTKEKQNPG